MLISECFLFQATGITNLLPGAVIDAALFDPCGYSANGLLNVSEQYSYSLVNNIITRDTCCSFGHFLGSLHIYAVVPFNPLFKFYFLLTETHCHA